MAFAVNISIDERFIFNPNAAVRLRVPERSKMVRAVAIQLENSKTNILILAYELFLFDCCCRHYRQNSQQVRLIVAANWLIWNRFI